MRSDRDSELTTPAAYRQEFPAANFYCMQFTIRVPRLASPHATLRSVTPSDVSPATIPLVGAGLAPPAYTRLKAYDSYDVRPSTAVRLGELTRPAIHQPDVPLNPANLPLSALLIPHQRQKLIPRLLIIAELPQHRAGHRLPVLLLHSAHLHA
jgi:hypothetical protein